MKREDYISFDEYFMALAKLSALRSKDPSTQVGACIVDQNNRCLSLGYNGTPNGFIDDKFPWDRDKTPLESKYLYVCHAELNAIFNYKGNIKDLKGSKIYVTLFPCNECTKILIQTGISEIIYESDKYAELETTIASKKMLNECNIKYSKYTPATKKINLDV